MQNSFDLAAHIDYTLLRPDATAVDIDALCRTASAAQFAAVCVNGIWVERVAALLDGTGVAVATVVGFPLGADPVAVKAAQTRELVARGADELDMVISLGHLLAGDVDYVTREIREIVAGADGRPVKVILETAALEQRHVEMGVRAARSANAHYVKTSTGMHPRGGATVEVVALLARLAGPDLLVKASGGIRTRESALQMIAAGAARIGTSTDLTSHDR